MKRLAIVTALIAALAMSAVALASSTLSGTFKTTITGSGANTLHGALDGTWKVSFKNGTYKVSDNGKAITKGKYTITGSTVSLTDKSGTGKCAGTGMYKFKLKGKKLTFTKVSDTTACAGRTGVLAHKFTKITSGPGPTGY
jgi:hypothetical protein